MRVRPWGPMWSEGLRFLNLTQNTGFRYNQSSLFTESFENTYSLMQKYSINLICLLECDW